MRFDKVGLLAVFSEKPSENSQAKFLSPIAVCSSVFVAAVAGTVVWKKLAPKRSLKCKLKCCSFAKPSLGGVPVSVSSSLNYHETSVFLVARIAGQT